MDFAIQVEPLCVEDGWTDDWMDGRTAQQHSLQLISLSELIDVWEESRRQGMVANDRTPLHSRAVQRYAHGGWPLSTAPCTLKIHATHGVIVCACAMPAVGVSRAYGLHDER